MFGGSATTPRPRPQSYLPLPRSLAEWKPPRYRNSFSAYAFHLAGTTLGLIVETGATLYQGRYAARRRN
jgi:hypothetical protein